MKYWQCSQGDRLTNKEKIYVLIPLVFSGCRLPFALEKASCMQYPLGQPIKWRKIIFNFGDVFTNVCQVQLILDINIIELIVVFPYRKKITKLLSDLNLHAKCQFLTVMNRLTLALFAPKHANTVLSRYIVDLETQSTLKDSLDKKT